MSRISKNRVEEIFSAQLTKSMMQKSLLDCLKHGAHVGGAGGQFIGPITKGELGTWNNIVFHTEKEKDLTLSQSILASMQACEHLLSGSESGDHAVKMKLDECLAQLQALKLVLALHGIVYRGDLIQKEFQP